MWPDLTQGYPVEPVDIHASVRHLHCINDFIRMTDKPWQAYSLGQQRNLDAIEMCRISHGVSEEDFDKKVRMTSVINTSSPLKLDTVMLEGILQMSARNQLIVLTPFTLSGAMAPVTLAGAAMRKMPRRWQAWPLPKWSALARPSLMAPSPLMSI